VPRAGLDAATVTAAGAALADEVGFADLAMGPLAERLGVRPPSLYKHVDGLADLGHRIAVLALTELADAVRDATAGLAGRDALLAAGRAMRTCVATHPGRYAATVGARPSGPGDPFAAAAERLLGSFAAALRGYRLAPDREVHALRSLRSALHGFVTLEGAGGFQMGTDVDESFTWMLEVLDQGLRAGAGAAAPVTPVGDVPPPGH
jgi:AcrR family transcriptional regulator